MRPATANRRRNGEPLSCIVNYLPATVARRIRAGDFRAHTMLDVLRRQLKIRVGAVRQEIEADQADPEIGRQLGIAVTTPVLYVETRVWHKDGVPLRYSQAFYRGDRSKYCIEVSG